MKKTYEIVALTLLIGTQPAIAQEIWVLEGMEMPESVLVDTQRSQLYVSNIVGHPAETDANGYLSRISVDGTVIEREWVTGLDAPKGMALVGNELLVADLNHLHIIDVETGLLTDSLAPDDAVFLNDVTSNENSAWISDLLTNTIWRYSDGTLEPWLQSEELAHPNGLLVDGQRLLVGSWGTGLQEDFSTDEPGALLAVDLASKAVSIVVHAVGNIDGIASVNGIIFVSDWLSGALLEVDEATKSFVETQRLPKGLADIAADDEALYLPLMLDGQVKKQLVAVGK
ncbi:MAG: hypothetical protein AB8B97_28220 [Granulosicoccus sp.]